MGPAVESEVEGAHDMLTNLSMGIGPKAKDIESFGELFRLMVKKMENFFAIEVPEQNTSGQQRLFPPMITLIGSRGVAAKYEIVEQRFNQGEGMAVSMADLQPLKAYGWVLSVHEAEQVRKWTGLVASGIGGGKNFLSSLEDDGQNCQSAIVAKGEASVGQPASSSSASQAPASKKAKAAEAKVADAHSNMLRFFFVGSKK